LDKEKTKMAQMPWRRHPLAACSRRWTRPLLLPWLVSRCLRVLQVPIGNYNGTFAGIEAQPENKEKDYGFAAGRQSERTKSSNGTPDPEQ